MDPMIVPYAQALEILHTDFHRVVEPLTDQEINWRHPYLSNTIGILLRHVAGSERYWIGEVVGGRPAQRNRASEFGHEPLSKGPLVEDLREAQAVATAVLERLTAADLLAEVEVTFRGRTSQATRAWAILHSLQHASYHLGQVQLFKKMATGGCATAPSAG